MEGSALRKTLTELQRTGILEYCKNIIVDRDSQSTKIINENDDCKHIVIRYDPGHIKKSLVNTLLKVKIYICLYFQANTLSFQ